MRTPNPETTAAMGNFVISIDFELYWGVRAKRTISEYHENLVGGRNIVSSLLNAFKSYGIASTFATVGFMFYRSKAEWIQHFPDLKPTYDLQDQSPYTENAIRDVEADVDGTFHFAPDIISQIKDEGHEVSTHTYSHYYCQEKGQTVEQFRADIVAAKEVADNFKIQLNSIVFPRNQYTSEYLKVCKDEGISTYRGNPKAFYYAPYGDHEDTAIKRLCRLADSYVNLSGYNCYSNEQMKVDGMVNIPASMFFRPYSPKLSFLERLKLKRIKDAMTHAAKHDLTYHLWWHPHNFGKNIDKNLALLDKVLAHYKYLSKKYAFRSVTMEQLGSELLEDGQPTIVHRKSSTAIHEFEKRGKATQGTQYGLRS